LGSTGRHAASALECEAERLLDELPDRVAADLRRTEALDARLALAASREGFPVVGLD
jgi:hypothetical protein